MIRNELKRAVFSRTFLLALALMTLFAVLSAVFYIEEWGGYNPNALNDAISEDGSYRFSPQFPLYSLFSAWLGGDTLSLAYTVFFALIPIGSALPYAWSYHAERKCGYLKNIVSRTTRAKYLTAKTAAVFTSGALVILIPYIINILLISAYIPYNMPWAGFNLYNRIYFGTMWADLIFTHPFLHMFLFVMLNVLYGGIYALLSYAVSFYIKNIVAVIFAPFVATLAVGYSENLIYSRYVATPVRFELDPTKFLHSRSVQYMQNPWVVLLITVLLLGFAVGTVYIKGGKHEVF